jgi:hypothetical protein
VTRCYQWNGDKNVWLKQNRSISFEEIVLAIQSGDEVDVFEHPNQTRYPGQKILVVIIENYAYLVPFIESEDGNYSITAGKEKPQGLRNEVKSGLTER